MAGDAFGGEPDLAEILAGLLEMALQPADPLVEPFDVGDQQADLLLDGAGLLAHLDVAQDGPDRGERRHQGGRRHDPHPPAVRFLDDVGEIGMELGIDRLARHEHQRRFGGDAGDDVFLGDRQHVAADVGGEGPAGEGRRGIAAGLAERVVGLLGELGVDRDRAGRVGQPDQAIDPAAAERGLQLEGSRGQGVAQQVFQQDLAEAAARLLVAENVLQPDHLARQLGDVLLRRVDHRQPLLQGAERLAGLLALLLQPVADPPPEVAEPLLEGLGQRTLLRLQPLGQLRLAGGLAVGELAEAAGELGLAGQHPAAARPAQQQQRQPEDGKAEQQDGDGQRRLHGTPHAMARAGPATPMMTEGRAGRTA